MLGNVYGDPADQRRANDLADVQESLEALVDGVDQDAATADADDGGPDPGREHEVGDAEATGGDEAGLLADGDPFLDGLDDDEMGFDATDQDLAFDDGPSVFDDPFGTDDASPDAAFGDGDPAEPTDLVTDAAEPAAGPVPTTGGGAPTPATVPGRDDGVFDDAPAAADPVDPGSAPHAGAAGGWLDELDGAADASWMDDIADDAIGSVDDDPADAGPADHAADRAVTPSRADILDMSEGAEPASGLADPAPVGPGGGLEPADEQFIEDLFSRDPAVDDDAGATPAPAEPPTIDPPGPEALADPAIVESTATSAAVPLDSEAETALPSEEPETGAGAHPADHVDVASGGGAQPDPDADAVAPPSEPSSSEVAAMAAGLDRSGPPSLSDVQSATAHAAASAMPTAAGGRAIAGDWIRSDDDILPARGRGRRRTPKAEILGSADHDPVALFSPMEDTAPTRRLGGGLRRTAKVNPPPAPDEPAPNDAQSDAPDADAGALLAVPTMIDDAGLPDAPGPVEADFVDDVPDEPDGDPGKRRRFGLRRS